jgi:hypothetical protein
VRQFGGRQRGDVGLLEKKKIELMIICTSKDNAALLCSTETPKDLGLESRRVPDEELSDGEREIVQIQTSSAGNFFCGQRQTIQKLGGSMREF